MDDKRCIKFVDIYDKLCDRLSNNFVNGVDVIDIDQLRVLFDATYPYLDVTYDDIDFSKSRIFQCDYSDITDGEGHRIFRICEENESIFHIQDIVFMLNKISIHGIFLEDTRRIRNRKIDNLMS